MTDSPLIRVLLVDDEPLARGMLREMLQGDPQVQIVVILQRREASGSNSYSVTGSDFP